MARKKAVIEAVAENAEPAEKPRAKKMGGPRPNSGGAREGAGRKPFAPTPADHAKVEELAGYGLSHECIAVLIRDGIGVDTLRKYFMEDIERGRAKSNGLIGKSLFDRAISGDTTAAIWWTKTQMGWKEQKEPAEQVAKLEIKITDA